MTLGEQNKMAANLKEVCLYVYGEEGTVGPISLANDEDTLFRAGGTEEFTVNLPQDQGDLYKIRIGQEDMDNNGCYLEKVRIT